MRLIMSYMPMVTVVVFSILACGCGGIDESGSERAVTFEYGGFLSRADNCSDELSPDDYSQESVGKCTINGYKYRYHYDILNAFLDTNTEAYELYTAMGESMDSTDIAYDDEVNTCHEAHLAIAVKNYLGSDGDSDLDEEAVNLRSAARLDRDIWKGTTTTSSSSQAVVDIYSKEYDSSSFYYCSGLIINEKWILTSAHCIEGSIEEGDSDTCSGCLMAYWWDPNSDDHECITDSSPNHASCSSQKTATFRKHGSYGGTGDSGDDVGLIYFSSGWNETISNARLYDETPSSWGSNVYVVAAGDNSMCGGGEGVKRIGSFDVDAVWFKYFRSDADNNYRTCLYDSGGSWLYNSGSFYLTFGVNSSSVIDDDGCSGTGTSCAAPEGANQYGTRVDKKVGWIKTHTDLTCPGSSDNGHDFVRCDY